mgnify:CR=1 FL=1
MTTEEDFFILTDPDNVGKIIFSSDKFKEASNFYEEKLKELDLSNDEKHQDEPVPKAFKKSIIDVDNLETESDDVEMSLMDVFPKVVQESVNSDFISPVVEDEFLTQDFGAENQDVIASGSGNQTVSMMNEKSVREPQTIAKPKVWKSAGKEPNLEKIAKRRAAIKAARASQAKNPQSLIQMKVTYSPKVSWFFTFCNYKLVWIWKIVSNIKVFENYLLNNLAWSKLGWYFWITLYDQKSGWF